MLSDVSREVLDPAALPGWDNPHDVSAPQAFGRTWIEQRRSSLLLVPSVVTAGRDTNAIVNAEHAETARIHVGPETDVALDRRLFGA